MVGKVACWILTIFSMCMTFASALLIWITKDLIFVFALIVALFGALVFAWGAEYEC